MINYRLQGEVCGCVGGGELVGGWERVCVCVYIVIVKYFPFISAVFSSVFMELLMFYC